MGVCVLFLFSLHFFFFCDDCVFCRLAILAELKKRRKKKKSLKEEEKKKKLRSLFVLRCERVKRRHARVLLFFFLVSQ